MAGKIKKKKLFDFKQFLLYNYHGDDMKKKIFYVLLFVSLLFFNVEFINAVTKVNCGNVTDIPKKIPEITSLVVRIVEIAVPIILVITGSMDLFKAVTAGKEDEMQKSKKILIKRLVLAAIVFFLIVITRFVVSVAASKNDSDNIVSCMDCFLSGKCNAKVVKPGYEDLQDPNGGMRRETR